MTNAEARFNKSLRPRKPEGSLGRTAQDGHLDSHTATELCLRRGCWRQLYLKVGWYFFGYAGLVTLSDITDKSSDMNEPDPGLSRSALRLCVCGGGGEGGRVVHSRQVAKSSAPDPRPSLLPSPDKCVEQEN